jgi:hypothetical protein
MHNSYILSSYSSQFALALARNTALGFRVINQTVHRGLAFPSFTIIPVHLNWIKLAVELRQKLKSSSKMPSKTRRLTSLAASKVIRKQALKTTVKKGQVSQRSGRQV